MRATQMLDGATYSDTKGSVRMIVGSIPAPAKAIELDWVSYRILSGPKSGDKLHQCTRMAFASWAKEKVADPERQVRR